VRFRIKPKHHYFCHSLLELERTRCNPFYFHCYADEDFVGKVAVVARAVNPRSMALRTSQRYVSFAHSVWFGGCSTNFDNM
jgi:hypothetical protein